MSGAPKVTSPHVDLSLKQPRKITRITRGQAYSLKYCQKGSSLHTQWYSAWKLYASGDNATVSEYRHLFSGHRSCNPTSFVNFQQAVIKERLTDATQEELDSLNRFIEECFERNVDARENPWKALSVNNSQLVEDLEKLYLKG